MKKEFRILIIVFSLLIAIGNQGSSTHLDQNKPSVLILYSDPEEATILSNEINSTAFEITSISINENTEIDISTFDILIFASYIEFDLSLAVEDSLDSFLQNNNSLSVFITPYIDSFTENTLDLMAIESSESPYGDEEDIEWKIQLNDDLDKYETSKNYTYTGSIAAIEYSSGNTTLSAVIDSNSTEEISYPFSAMTRVDADSTIYICPLALIQNHVEEVEEQIVLTQLGNLSFISDFIVHFLQDTTDNKYQEFIQTQVTSVDNTTVSSNISQESTTVIGNSTTDNPTTNTNTSIPIQSTPPDNEDPSISFPGNPSNPINWLIIVIAMLFIFLYKRILRFLGWIRDYAISGFVLIVGAYFHIEDRNLNPGEVLMNQYRAQILDYLEAKGGLGMHLREIKKHTSLGSGSLLWHLQVLEDFGYIYKVNIKRNTVFVAADYLDDFDMDLKILDLKLKSENSVLLLQKLSQLSKNQFHIEDLLHAEEMNRRTVIRFLEKLIKADIVKDIENGYEIISLDKLDLLNKGNIDFETFSSPHVQISPEDT
ncbi:MAG: hypothetical protein INQ03_14600 [Candidatus Heimdallarchaeota archaeon]|nr:hypothetical protein [Candidatus Heimdallarchaeota archaeon]